MRPTGLRMHRRSKAERAVSGRRRAVHEERAARTRRRLKTHGPPVLFDDPLDEREPNSRTGGVSRLWARRRNTAERLEDPVMVGSRDADPAVPDPQGDETVPPFGGN